MAYIILKGKVENALLTKMLPNTPSLRKFTF